MAAGLTQQQVADAVGVTKSSVAQWENGQTKNLRGKNLVEASKVLGVKPEWLISGYGPMRSDENREHVPSIGTNVEPLPGEIRWVPLVSWIQAGYGADAVHQLEPEHYEDLRPCPVKCSDQTFALRVRGESMEPDYQEGDIVFVDPKVEPRHRSDIVVFNHASAEAMLKRLIIEGDRRYLRALNPLYQEPVRMLTEEDRVCGVVVFSGRYR